MNSEYGKSKTDLRVVKTREAIREAFERLVETNEYPNITVSAIAREARISRKTFYAHYSSLDDLLQELSLEIVRHVAGEVQPDGELLTVEEWVSEFTRLMFKTLRNNPHLDTNVIKCVPLAAMLSMLKEPFLRICSEELEKRGLELTPGTEYFLVFYLGGLNSVYEEWQLSGQSPETLDDIAQDISHYSWIGIGKALFPQDATAE